MKKNKLYKIFFTFLLLSTLLACAKVNDSIEDPLKPNPDGPVQVEDLPLEMKYSLLDKEYRLPTSYKELKADGWILEDNPDFILESEQFIKNRFVRNGSYILDLSFYNGSDESQTIDNSLVASIAAENRTFGQDVASDIVIHGSINFDSTIEDIINELGEYELNESAQFDSYTFQNDALSKTEIKIEKDTDTIRWIIIENFKQD